MRGPRHLAMAALGAIVLGACTPQPAPSEGTPAPEEAAGQSFSRDMSAGDKASCTAGGGTVQRRGRAGVEQCVRPFADAGKQCTDSAQCQGKCVGDAGAASTGGAVTGQCQTDNRLYGCYAEIKGGKAVNAICVD